MSQPLPGNDALHSGQQTAKPDKTNHNNRTAGKRHQRADGWFFEVELRGTADIKRQNQHSRWTKKATRSLERPISDYDALARCMLQPCRVWAESAAHSAPCCGTTTTAPPISASALP